MPDATPVAVIGCRQAIETLRKIGCTPLFIHSRDDLFLHKRTAPPWLIVVEAAAIGQRELGAVVSEFKASLPLIDVVVWAPRASPSLVREAFQAGAKDVVVQTSPRKLVKVVQEVLDEQQLVPKLHELSDQRMRSSRFESLLSRSDVMWDVFEQVTRVASSDATILIIGETGTGKELLARAIHRRSGRPGRFVACNCGSISPQLIESELFGHEKGAFTGATRAKKGLARHADNGTLFLDEIGDMPESVQINLLRILQEKKVRPVGSHEEIDVSTRIVTATNVALDEAVEEGRFREDLFYRLDVIRINVPPLRDRPEDVVFLFGYFMKRLTKHYDVERPTWTDAFLDALVAFDWPGNVRQLENFAERVVLAEKRRKLNATDFQRIVESEVCTAPVPNPTTARPKSPVRIDPNLSLAENLDPIVQDAERSYLIALLEENQGRISESAKKAGISRRTLLRKLTMYGIDKSDFK